jgi:hypothetical protein
MTQFSRLELRDILAHVDRSRIDPDVLAKLESAASNRTIVQYTEPEADLTAVRNDLASQPRAGGPLIHSDEFHPIVITPAFRAHPPWTQAQLDENGLTLEEAVERVNQNTKVVWDAQQKVRANYKPIVGEANASNPNAAYAPPDIPASPPPEQTPVGRKNRWGHECVAMQGGVPVFKCDEGHGYTYNAAVPGCSQCFLVGNASTPVQREDHNAIPGEDSSW